MAFFEKTKGYIILVATGNKTPGIISIPFSNQGYMIISDPLPTNHFLIEMEAAYPDIPEPVMPLLIPDAYKKSVKEQKHILRQIEKSGYGPDNPLGDWNGHVIAGYMDEIHKWHHKYGADLCALFIFSESVGFSKENNTNFFQHERSRQAIFSWAHKRKKIFV